MKKHPIKDKWPKRLREKYDAEIARLDAKFKPRIDAIREAERLTEDDYKIRFNAR